MGSNKTEFSIRKKAEAIMASLPETLNQVDHAQIKDLIEELNVHQIELELQNEELAAVQKTLENSRQRYVELFDKAPVGYVILDRIGLIKQFNTTFFNLVGQPDVRQRKIAFADLLTPEDGELFRARFKAFFKAPEGKQIHASLHSRNGQTIRVLLEGRYYDEMQASDASGGEELLPSITDVSELEQTRQRLTLALNDAEFREKRIAALLKGARAVLKQTDFITTARALFDSCSEAVGSSSGYIALLSDDGSENEVLFLEDGGLPCTVDPELPMPIRGLREDAYRKGKVVYDNQFMKSEWTRFLPEGHVALENVMFAPLIIEGKSVGVMGLANKSSDFTKEDAVIAGGFGELAAIALKNNRISDKRNLAEAKNEKLIQELQDALAKVKTLSGLIPICSHCKKIRDDKGYWNQLEDYLDEHSDAVLSHGICQECSKIHYPDLNLYDD